MHTNDLNQGNKLGKRKPNSGNERVHAMPVSRVTYHFPEFPKLGFPSLTPYYISLSRVSRVSSGDGARDKEVKAP